MNSSNTSDVKRTLKYSNCSVINKTAEQSKNSAGDKSTGQINSSDENNLAETSMCANTLGSMTHSKHLRVKRTLNDLNLMDSFLFSAITERIQNAELVARIIVERATGIKLGKVIIETEKQLLGIDAEHRGVRLDLCISELDNEQVARIYDIEPNNYDLTALPKRDRYNQALADVKLLKSNAGFKELPEYVSIWLLPDDPFDDGRMIYTVKNMVVENEKIVYNDGVMRLFLNAKGKKGGNEALKTLLNYFSNSCKANAIDSELEKLHNIVTDVKLSREVGERYMSWQDYVDYEIKTGIKEGIEAELGEIREQIKQQMREELKEQIREELKEQTREELKEQIREELKEQTREELKDQIREELKEQTREELKEQIREELKEQTREELKEQIREELREQTREELKDQINEELKEQSNYSISILIKNSIALGATKEKVISMLMRDYSLTEDDATKQVIAELAKQ